jgi:GH15 family glucan-1,4-alpha-glucosidase
VRRDGYADIRDYALIGDGRTTALVALDGAIDWLCLPNPDSSSVLGAILDKARGGTFIVRPSVPFQSSRRYLPSTNVLETTFTTDAGVVRVIDAMVLPLEGLAPMRELARSIEGVSGTVPMRWCFAPRFQFGRETVRHSMRYGMPVAESRAEAVALCHWNAGAPEWRDSTVEAAFEISAGKSALLVLTGAYAEPLVLPARREVRVRLQRTIQFWKDWTKGRHYEGPWPDAVLRSALVLKSLIFAPSGASAAAPTTSLPEEIGGVRNWDYRYCWIRDSMFLIDALLRLGCHDEAHALFWWFMQATAITEPELQVLYRLDGGANARERTLDLSGYRNSAPVRVGNAAIKQSQLDIYGDLLETAWVFGRGGRKIDRDTGSVLAGMANHVCDHWHEKDSGIWEVRGDLQHFTHSKAMCWVALDRAIRLAEEHDLPGLAVERWKREAVAIADFVNTKCWSEALGSYTRSAGSQHTDASLLMLSLMGFGDPTGVRMQGTIDAISKELKRGPHVFRYRSDDGLPGKEGCFFNCSFWLAGALARAKRVDEATALMNELLALANDVGLYSEEIDPESGEFLGNFPQALVHLSLIDAAFAVGEATASGPASQKAPAPTEAGGASGKGAP